MSADGVAWLFVQQYYTALHKTPSILYKFYREDSKATHGAEGEPTSLAEGLQGVRGLIATKALENCKIQVTSMDSLPGIDGSIVIQVLGELSNNSELARKFSQTFVLANTGPQEYYIASDILRLIDIASDVSASHRSTRESTDDTVETAAESFEVETAVKGDAKADAKTDAKADAKADAKTDAKTEDLSEIVVGETDPSSASGMSSKQGSPAVSEHNSSKEGRDKSWAATARTFVPFSAVTPPQPQYIPYPMYPMPVPMADPRVMHHRRPHHQQHPRNMHQNPNCSVHYDIEDQFVTNHSEIQKVMNQYGPVGNVYYNSERSYGNVQFENEESAQRALGAGSTTIDGHKVNFERRRRYDGNH